MLFDATLSNAAYGYSSDTKYIVSVGNLAVYCDLNLTIPGLTVFNDVLVPLFEILGVEKMPTLKAGASGEDLAKAIVTPLLSVIDELLASPLTTVLEILPNLVYFISMDTIQEKLNMLNIALSLKLEPEVDKDNSGTLVDLLGGTLFDLLGDKLAFDVDLAIADMIDLYDMLGFEISDFNEILNFVVPMLGVEGISLPPIKQQEIIFCSDWGTSKNGNVYLTANEGDLMYWFLNYAVSALIPDENGNSLLTSLLGADMDPAISSIIEKVVAQFTSNPRGALAALIELLNPVAYDTVDMTWMESQFNYNDIEGADQMSIVYLNYGNDWNRETAEYLVNNANDILDTVLALTGTEMEDLGTMLQGMLNGLFTNANITALVEMLGGLGDSPSAIINDILDNQIGINIESWFTAFGYLYPAETWADDAEIIPLGHRNYVNNFGVEGIANEDGTISWFFNRMPLVDGDGYTFVNILTRLLGEASLLVEFLFAGADVSAFNDLLTLHGYETYATSIGLVLAILGVENLPTQEDFNNDAMGSLTNMLMATLDWFYALTSSDDMIAQLIEIIPDLFYFIESNGLSTILRNLLTPVWVLVDTVRPLVDVDINSVLSLVVSEFLNYGTLDINVILEYIVHGIYMNDDLDNKWYNIDIFNLTFTEIIKLADIYLGTSLYESGLVQVGIKGFCSGIEMVENSPVGTIYTSTLNAVDTVTILVTAILDCLTQPAKVEGMTNGEVIFAAVAELAGNDAIADLYPAVEAIINGVEIEYADPNWGYMFESADAFSLTLPEQSIVYLGYNTDWDAETAANVYSALDDILDMVMPSLLEEGETIATLLNGLLEDNVYSDEILNTVVELLVNLLADFDATLFKLVDLVVDTDINAWFTYCELDETTGEYVCTYDWGVDAAAAADKKDMFIAGIKAVLAPANSLLAWIFFGEEYEFFTGSDVDDEGNYVYNSVLTLKGGEGYAYGLAPIFEALGCTMQPAETFYDAATGTYNVGDAVESILDSVLALVDEISANPVEEVFNLLPNLIYFINADGLKASVRNLLAPVNGIVEKLSPVISEDGSEVSIGALLEGTIGLNIENITTATLLGFAADAGIQMSSEMLDIICSLYVGKLAEFTSVNGRTAYKLDVTGYEGDVLTIVLSIALDLFNLNSDLFSDLLGEDIYWTVYNLIRGATEEFTYRDLNWGYMYEGETNADKLAALEAANGKLPDRTNEAYDVYTMYQNNWNKHTADYVTEVLDTLVHDITTAARSDGSSLGQLLDQAISDGLYQDSILNSLIELVVDLLVDYEDIVNGAGALLGAESLTNWFDYCDITTDENGDTVVTCTYDWGVDAAETIDEKREAFIDAFATVLEPAYDILAWLFFAEDFTFLEGTTGDPLITIKGGRGYEEAFVPLFEAVGVLMKRDANGNLLSVEDTYLNGESAVLPASYFYVNGELDMELAVKTIFAAVTDWLYDICGDLANQGDDGVITSMLERLANVFYSINADGLKVVVNNLTAPIMYLLEAIAPFGVEVDFNELIGIEGMDIFDFDFDDLFALLADEDVLGLYFPDYTQEFIKSFYIGELVEYRSANGESAYYMAYTAEESAAEMITCVIGFVVDAFQDPRNPEILIDWMGEDVYYGIMAVLGLQGVKDMQAYEWLYTEYADTDKTFSGLETSKMFDVSYNYLWTVEKAQYIADNFDEFVDTMLGLIGLKLNGYTIRSLDDLVDALLDGGLYTQATVDSLLEMIRDLAGNLTDLEPYGEYIIGVLDRAFGVNLAAWDTMELTVVDGDRASFVAALEQIVAPIVPLLNVLLCGENIELFYTIEPANMGESALTIYGSEGYAYGIVPIFEALGCTMMAPEEFKALNNEDKVGVIINALVDRIDEIVADPANNILEMLPAVIYFINSNGLDTAVNNILNSVDTVLIALEPIVGATSLMELLGLELAEYNFEYLMNLAVDAVKDSTGLDISTVLVDFVSELVTGKVVSYQSANGETYYTMQYAGEWQKTDMVTIILRLLVTFLAEGNNADAIVALIAMNSESEGAANSAGTLINFVVSSMATEPGTSSAMSAIYYVFYSTKYNADQLNKGYQEFNYTWRVILTFFETFGDPFTSASVTVLKTILDEYFGGVVDSSGVASEGAMTFFERIAAFFQRIGDFFRRLFGLA